MSVKGRFEGSLRLTIPLLAGAVLIATVTKPARAGGFCHPQRVLVSPTTTTQQRVVRTVEVPVERTYVREVVEAAPVQRTYVREVVEAVPVQRTLVREIEAPPPQRTLVREYENVPAQRSLVREYYADEAPQTSRSLLSPSKSRDLAGPGSEFTYHPGQGIVYNGDASAGTRGIEPPPVPPAPQPSLQAAVNREVPVVTRYIETREADPAPVPTYRVVREVPSPATRVVYREVQTIDQVTEVRARSTTSIPAVVVRKKCCLGHP